MLDARAPIGTPLAHSKRRRQIMRQAADQVANHFVPYRGRYVKAPVINVGADVLVYRAENGRLITQLREHAASQGKDVSSLLSNQDTAEVQQVLHAMLVAQANDPRGPILAELERQQLQTEPLLITAEGVVVNGNRRLAAMRELLHRDAERYASFAEVSAAMLPADAKPADLEFVEATLQMAPETKLAYGWIGRRLKMRRQRDELGLPVELMCESYRLEDAAEIDRELEELALAEDYLESFRGEPGHYSLISEAEDLFVGLRERLSVLPQDLRRLWRLAGFAMIDGRASVHGPMDRHFPFAPPVPQHLPALTLRSFAEDHDLLTPSSAGEDATVLSPKVQESLAALFGDLSQSGKVASELFRLMDRLRAEHQDQQKPKQVLRQLGKVRESLSRLEPDRFTGHEGRQLRSELAAIQAQVSYLLGDHEPVPKKMTAASAIGRLFKGS